MSSDVKEAKERALALLARREHSETELQRKLTARGFSKDCIRTSLTELKAENLQSDRRFAESFINSRMEKGYGPLRIRLELQERGVSDTLVDTVLQELEPDWESLLSRVRHKKFGGRLPSDYKEQARQSRFLQYRGFDSGQIRSLFKAME